MPNETLAARLRDQLLARSIPNEEKKMFGGIAFMVRGNMCVGVTHKGDLLIRINPAEMDVMLKKKGVAPMTFTGRPMKGFVFVNERGYDKDSDLQMWLETALKYIHTLPIKASTPKTVSKKKAASKK